MQVIHDDVTVFVMQRELQARASKADGTSASTTALQYIAENSGFDVITFRVDFSESANIKLHRHAERGSAPMNTLQKASQEMAFDCELKPFERRVLAYVVKRGKKRAFVRVQYVVTAIITPSVDVIVGAQEKAAKNNLLQLQRSNQTFSRVNKWKALPYRPESEVERACNEINRYFREFGNVFVDTSFPPGARSLDDPEVPNKLSEVDSAIYTLCTWEHLHNIADSSWNFVASTQNLSKFWPREPVASVSCTSGLPTQDSFLCAMAIVAPFYEMWLFRWFPTLDAVLQVENMAAIHVALCDRGLSWQHLLIDLFLPSFPLGRGLMTPRNVLGELCPSLIHKAYAKLKGSYAAVSSIPTMNMLQELTGSPWVCFYRTTTEKDDVDPFITQVQLQEAVQAMLSHRRHNSDEISALVVVTCGKLDGHHRAFRLRIPSDEDSHMNFIVLHDASGKYLRQQRARHLAEFDQDQDPSVLRLSWEQFFELEPALWSLTLGRRHEQRLRQILLHEGDTAKMTVVISVPVLSTIVFSSSYLGHFPTKMNSQQPQVNLDISMALVETDFSLTPIETNNVDNLSMNFQAQATSHDGVFSKQVVRTLSAGEYVVTISAKRAGRSESHPNPSLTPVTVDANLELLFDCLDRERKYELSKNDINSFLQLYEHVTPSQHGKEALRSFLYQHGSSSSPGSEEKRLTRDDFQEIYLSQAIQDCRASNQSHYNAGIRARFQDLVWEDLLRLLPSSGSDVEAENSRTEIDCRDVVEVICCFHSDTPLLSVTTLPEDESSLDSNNFNI